MALTTGADYLGPALREQEGLIASENGAYGTYITEVDGEAASDGNQTFWCITKDGEETTTGADSVPIANGDSFGLILTHW
ncbi:MAG: DUF4430 domain-containing protein [Intestinimonas sp.]|nr:DUF4430 domain-containing protein [Intestinimonas sp.]